MKFALRASTALAGVLLTVPVSAQQNAVEEITVTAQKREATLLETPIAVSVVGGAEVERAQARDIRDIQTLVPSLQVNTFNSSTDTAFSIRGVGSSTFNFGIEPAVGVFVDGVYRSRNGASINDFLSLERVEVLRGPQSTLFGKNTSAGVINFITKAPDLSQWGGEAEATYGNFDATVLKAAITGPLVEETLAIRLDGNYNQRDGFVTNVNDGRDLNNRDRWGLNGTILWTPSDEVSLRIAGDYAEYDEDCCAAPFLVLPPGSAGVIEAFGGTALPPDPNERLQAVDDTVNTTVETRGISSTLDWDFDWATLTSITAYREYREDSEIDPDFTDVALTEGRVFDRGYDTFTQELRIASSGGADFNWQAGVYYFDQDLVNDQQVVYTPLIGPFLDAVAGGGISALEGALGLPTGTFFAPGTGLLGSRFDQTNETFSVFGQFDWDITDKLTLTGGMRWTRDEKSATSDINIVDTFAAIDLVATGPQVVLPQVIAGQLGIPLEQAIPIVQGALADPTNPASAPVVQTLQFLQANATDPAVNPFIGLAQLQLNPPAPNIDDEFVDKELTGNVIINYAFSDQINAYVSYARGFKGGAFALDAGATRLGPDAFIVRPETVDSFEFGVKARLLDRRLSINAAVFTQETQDFQQFTFVGTGFFPANADLRTEGLEWESSYVVNDYFRLSANFTWLFTNEYTNFPQGPCPSVGFENVPGCALTQLPGSVTPIPVRDFEGEEQSGFPEFSGVIVGNFNYPISDDLEMFARAEFAYQDSRFLVATLDPLQVSPSQEQLGASIGFGAADQSWSVQFWGRNLTNDEFLQSSFPNPIGFGINAYPNDPRTYGITVRTKF